MTARRRARLAALVGLALFVPLGCTSGSGIGPDGATATGVAVPATPPLAPGQVAHDVGTSFQYQSFVISVGRAVYDPAEKRLALGLRYNNISGRWAQTAPSGELDVGDGTKVHVAGDLVQVPPGVSVDITAVADSIAHDPVDGGVVTWGSPSFDQPSFRLDGRGGDHLWLPADVALDKWSQIGKFGVHITGVQVNASKVDLGIQADPGKRVLRVFAEEYTAKGTTSPFRAGDNLLLRIPSGEVLDAVDSTPAASQLSWTSQGGQWADFEIPADLNGKYEVQLASAAKLGFGTIRPELIERRPIPFELENVRPGPAPTGQNLASPLYVPPGAPGEGDAFAVDVNTGSMNIPGYDFRPTHLAYDPAKKTATLDATVTSLVSSSGPTGGVLSGAPSFGFQTVLAFDGHLATGTTVGDAKLDTKKPSQVNFEFTDVQRLNLDGAGLYVGPSDGAVSSMPLGPRSNVRAWPPPHIAQTASASTITAGDWTVQLRAYRVGLFNPSLRPAVGRRQLEMSLKITASQAAHVNALGLSFQPQYQVLIGSGTGYDQGAIADSGLVEVKPAETVDLTVTFDVPDTFAGGHMPFAVRSRAEFGDLGATWVETRFLADLTTQTTGAGDFG